MGSLFTVRNNFYVGAYQAAINGSDVKDLSAAEAAERDLLVYRSYIALGSYQLVIDEITTPEIALQAVKLLAIYLSGDKETARNTLKEWLADPSIASNNDVLLIAGIIYSHDGEYNEALKYTHAGGTLELNALNVQLYLHLNRPERAEQQLKIMQKVDEDHTLTQLANAWVDLVVGGTKIEEASVIYQELCEKHSWAVPLINARAVCNMHLGHFEDAESLLLEALSKDAKDADTLANLVVCELHRSKPITRYLSQLKSLKPHHPLVERVTECEANFQRAVAAMA